MKRTDLSEKSLRCNCLNINNNNSLPLVAVLVELLHDDGHRDRAKPADLAQDHAHTVHWREIVFQLADMQILDSRQTFLLFVAAGQERIVSDFFGLKQQIVFNLV